MEKEFWNFSQSGIKLNLNQKKFNPALDQIGIIFDTKSTINQALRYGKLGNFFIRFWQNSKMLFGQQNFKPDIRIDKTKLYPYLEYIGENEIRPSQDAFLHYTDTKDSGYFEIVPEQEGKTVDINNLSDSIISKMEKITNLKEYQFEEIKLKIKNTQASITKKDLIDIQKEANQLVTRPFKFIFENQEFIAESKNIAQWLEFVEINKKIKIELDELAINNYLDTIAKDIDIAVVNKVVEINQGQKITKREGKAGRQLNRALALEQIINNFFSDSLNAREIVLETQTIEPAEKIIYPDSSPIGGMYPGKYIEINISAKQKLYLWNGNQLIGGPYSISSGKPGYYTPTGTFKIISKNPMAWSSKYGLYMPYWMQFTGAGHGIHELPEWPGGYKEGANHLGLRVSHGCVRLGVGPAAYVYNWAPIGTPIYIHY